MAPNETYKVHVEGTIVNICPHSSHETPEGRLAQPAQDGPLAQPLAVSCRWSRVACCCTVANIEWYGRRTQV